MPPLSIEELKRLIRKLEFNKTEPELLIDLVNKARREGEGERERLKRISTKSSNILELLKKEQLIYKIDSGAEKDELMRVPAGAVDGSFQIVGGLGRKWFAIYGVSQIVAEKGFTLNPMVKVDGNIEVIEAVDEGEAHRNAEILMMLGETKSIRKVAEIIASEKSYLLIDGPIIDPPVYAETEYISNRVNALRFCSENNVHVIGFVKRILGRNYMNFLASKFRNEINVSEFTNDLDLLAPGMYHLFKELSCPIYTCPISYDEGVNKADKLIETYKHYQKKGLSIYYSYYKPSLRGRIFRIELASFVQLDREELLKEFHRIFVFINKVWTLPGFDEPLLITVAHNKCNVRRGAAETLYYEIITRALSEGGLPLWLET